MKINWNFIKAILPQNLALIDYFESCKKSLLKVLKIINKIIKSKKFALKM